MERLKGGVAVEGRVCGLGAGTAARCSAARCAPAAAPASPAGQLERRAHLRGCPEPPDPLPPSHNRHLAPIRAQTLEWADNAGLDWRARVRAAELDAVGLAAEASARWETDRPAVASAWPGILEHCGPEMEGLGRQGRAGKMGFYIFGRAMADAVREAIDHPEREMPSTAHLFADTPRRPLKDHSEAGRVCTADRLARLAAEGWMVAERTRLLDLVKLRAELEAVLPYLQSNDPSGCTNALGGSFRHESVRGALRQAVDLLVGVGFRAAQALGMRLVVPSEIMVSCYRAGHHYRRHLDSYGPRDNPRALTAILYVNPGWQQTEPGEGGLLRGWSGRGPGGEVVFEVLPESGNLVLFNSREVWHEVVANKRRPEEPARMAVQQWFWFEDLQAE